MVCKVCGSEVVRVHGDMKVWYSSLIDLSRFELWLNNLRPSFAPILSYDGLMVSIFASARIVLNSSFFCDICLT